MTFGTEQQTVCILQMQTNTFYEEYADTSVNQDTEICIDPVPPITADTHPYD